MYFSKMFLPTMREVPAEAEILSHKLMLKAGMIRKLASGIYSFLPLGLRSLKKIEEIVREEMYAADAQELLMPAVLPAESYIESGRWDTFGPEMFRLKDRNNRDFCLGPTHEEIFTQTVKHSIRSYRALPLTLYQIQTKYRDEIRPRFGVMRSREFVMKDAYSFDKDEAGLDESYLKMADAYKRIFERLGLNYTIVEASTGAMGGTGSQEFMVLSEIGEDEIVCCSECGYGANLEKASCLPANNSEIEQEELPVKKMSTPDIHTITELTEFLNCKPYQAAKTIIYNADGNLVAALVRGDREISETKLMDVLKCESLEMAEADEVINLTNAEVGFAGPVNLAARIIVDQEVALTKNLIVGANETGYHLINVNFGRDFSAEVNDIRVITEEDPCPKCKGKLQLSSAIEVGHIFKLGTKYSEALKCNYIDEEGQEQPMIMGCYGIGINRTLAAVIEQNNDENGIIWPMEIAPYQVIIVPVNVLDEKVMDIAYNMYERLRKSNIEVILDDRNERAGVKFKDADLIGIPIRINIGRKAQEGLVEFKPRRTHEALTLTVDEAIEKTMELVNSAKI